MKLEIIIGGDFSMANLKKWEYRSFHCATFGGESLKELNSLGEEGWESQAVIKATEMYVVLLKREK